MPIIFKTELQQILGPNMRIIYPADSSGGQCPNLNGTLSVYQVFISTRQGSWVMSRISEDGYPWDMVFHTRFSSMLRNVLPRTVVKWMMEQQMNQWFNHENYGLEPQNK
jgi:hypothetical protein